MMNSHQKEKKQHHESTDKTACWEVFYLLILVLVLVYSYIDNN